MKGETRIQVTILPVEEDDIDVGAVIQLIAAKLTHRQYAESSVRVAPMLAERMKNTLIGLANANLSDFRDVSRRFGKIGQAGDFAKRDSEHLLRLPALQRFVTRITRDRLDPATTTTASPRVEHIRTGQPFQQFRPPHHLFK